MSNNKYISLNVANNGGGGGGGDIDSGAVLSIVNSAITSFSNDLQEGEPIVGMAKQLYSPDGVTSEGAFTYRTTGGDKDVSTGNAELRKIEGNSIYPELQYNDSAALERGGSEVTGFTYDIEWGDRSEWVAVQGSDSFSAKKVRIKDPNGYPGVWLSNGSYYQLVRSEGNTYGTWNQMTDISGDGTRFLMYDNLGEAYVDEDYIVFEVYNDNEWVAVSLCDENAGQGASIYQTNVIPNDIPNGESTYIFTIDENNVLGSWTPSLPQALQNMQIDGSDYEPQDGDEITINRSLYKEGSAQFSTPRTFVSVGLNSFNKDADTPISTIIGEGWYAVKGVTGLEKGYTIYDENSGITAVGLNSTPDSTGAELLDNVDAALNYITPTAEKPWIVFQTANADKVCVHPKWSGYNDLIYEPYEESKVEGLLSFVTVCPMWSVGNVRNIIDIEGGQSIYNIISEEYSPARVNELLSQGKVLGVDFDFDSTLIYKVLDNPVVTPITFDGEYKANDFGVEYFLDADGIIPTPLYATTYYMNNLVDKLRRMEADYIILDNLDGQGEEGQLYSYNNRLMKWVNGAGRWGKWIIGMDGNMSSNVSTLNQSNIVADSYLVYTYLPFTSTTLLCSFKLVVTNRYLGYFPDENKLKVFDNNSLTGTSIAEISMDGEEADITASNRHMYISWVDGKIRFRNDNRFSSMNGNYVDTSISTPHYEALDVDYFDGTANMDKTAGAGFAVWNSEGKVVNGFAPNTKYIRINTTGSSSSIQVLYANNFNFPERIWCPTAGGTSGQILTSAGDNAAPTWTNWIKSVQITSDEYEALATKDPNTLYLLVD